MGVRVCASDLSACVNTVSIRPTDTHTHGVGDGVQRLDWKRLDGKAQSGLN